MAKSFDREIVLDTINDDLIKEALKEGLTSIKASDNLIMNTIARCQNEITNEKQKHKTKKIMPWLYKLGAPLAAGALILVLLINGNGILLKKSADLMPQASSMKAPTNENAMDSFAVPEDKRQEGLASAPASEPDAMEADPELNAKGSGKSFGSSQFNTLDNGGSIAFLNSSVNRSSNNTAGSLEESIEVFHSITEQYNTVNNTKLDLEEDAITRIHTVIAEGVSAEELINTKSYLEILSNEGYWALPLKSEAGAIEEILTVNTIDSSDPNIAISNRDTVFVVDKVSYLVSALENSKYISTELVDIFNSNTLNSIVSDSGYKNDSEIIVADINRGMDFVALARVNGNEIAIPLLTNELVFNLTNRRVYFWDEFCKVVSMSMVQ